MNFQAISDTHGKHENLQLDYSDVLIFAGDNHCLWEWQLSNFFEWFSEQPSKYKIFIPGNHDIYCEKYPEESRQLAEDYDIIYLVDEEIIINGIKFYGSPFTPNFCNWAFMLPRDRNMEEKWRNIPYDTDVLITHGPPKNILDWCPNGSVGCEELRKRVFKVKPKYHIFGHIHESAGCYIENGIKFLNVSVLNGQYIFNNLSIQKGTI